jgi:hypothetical protein
MVTTTLSPTPVFKAFDNNGAPLASGKLFTYAAGTTTKLATYTDSTGGTPNTNPVILNARGEANVWVPPNVAYKYVLAPSTDSDPPTSPFWTIDNIVSSQLITLYGGVDTGSANAYVLNFTANFTSYVDGIIIYWIPANTNTGASTINVNGLGVVNIVNPDGSALVTGEITANQPAQILFKSGAFELITATTTIYGSFTPSWGGFSVVPATTPIAYRRNGTLVSLIFNPVNGTSNANSFTMSNLPSIITPRFVAAMSYPVIGLLDNSARIPSGLAAVNSAGTITFYKDGTQALWTAAGAKGFADFVGLNYTV